MNANATDIELAVEYAQAGNNPTTITKVTSGWVFLGLNQVLRGCCLLVAEPVVESIDDLEVETRNQFFADMLRVGRAIRKVTGADKVNYLLLGNKDPALHVHIVPRYADEADEFRAHGPWKYSEYVKFDIERDAALIRQLKQEIDRND